MDSTTKRKKRRELCAYATHPPSDFSGTCGDKSLMKNVAPCGYEPHLDSRWRAVPAPVSLASRPALQRPQEERY